MKKTFRSKIILMNTVSVVIALLISSTYLLVSFSRITRENAVEQIERTIDNQLEIYSSNIEDLYNLSYSLIAVPAIRQWFSKDVELGGDELKDAIFIQNLKLQTDSTLMFNTTWKSKIVTNIGLFSDDYNTILAQRLSGNVDDVQLSLSEVYRKTKKIDESGFFFRSGDAIFYIQRVYNSTCDEAITYIYEINTDIFVDYLESIPDEIELNILFYGSTIYSHKTNIGKQSFAIEILNKLYPDVGFCEIRPIDETPLEFEIVVPNAYLNRPIVSTLNTLLIVSIVMLIIITVIVALLSSSTTKFIVRLIDGINEIKTHKMGTTLKRDKNKDLDEIVDAFNSMSLELQRLIDKGYKSDVLLLQSDIRQLQSQMNPHFLINTLTSISTNSLLNGDEKTYEMITALSTVLEQSMFNTKDNSPFIPLEEEMKYVNCYLKIQKFRFEDKLKINVKIDESLYPVFVPRLSIEPLVENAVIHGVEDSIEQGVIDIEIKRVEDDLYAIVSDNGKSFERDFTFINKDSHSHHIAVKNTNSRIHLLFGEEYGITYNFEIANKTKAVLHLPYIDNRDKPIEELYSCIK
jgi:two-component system sensor histidine kinase YesM